jgi:hypothetical protein
MPPCDHATATHRHSLSLTHWYGDLSIASGLAQSHAPCAATLTLFRGKSPFLSLQRLVPPCRGRMIPPAQFPITMRHSAFHIRHSMFRIPHCAFHIPHSGLNIFGASAIISVCPCRRVQSVVGSSLLSLSPWPPPHSPCFRPLCCPL